MPDDLWSKVDSLPMTLEEHVRQLTQELLEAQETIAVRDKEIAELKLCRVRHRTGKLVILESPFAGDQAKNVEYARACLRDSLVAGCSPFASHLLYTQNGVLDDRLARERAMGINAGLCWGDVADKTVVYTDLGISSGMKHGIRAAEIAGRPVEYKKLGKIV